MPQIKQSPVSSLFKQFNPLEIITFIYAIITGIYILVFYSRIYEPYNLLFNRLAITGCIIILSLLNKKSKSSIIKYTRLLLPAVLIIYWYPETYYLNHNVLFPVLDPFFNNLDIKLFRCSPAMEFSESLPYPWFSEIMYFAYFSYYLIYAYIIFLLLFKYRDKFYPIIFKILTSFFIFYILFIFIPVEGPQFYWPYPDNQVPEGYIFSRIMRFTQELGEKPTAAFPSSHVGMTLIYLYILFKIKRKALIIILPVSLLLFCSTVYIKAHYLIDVLAAFIMTPVIYWISLKFYHILFRQQQLIKYKNKRV